MLLCICLHFPSLNHIYLIFTKSVIKCKCMIINVLRNSINFHLGLYNFDLRISTWNSVYFSIEFFLFWERSLSYTYTKFNLSARIMRSEQFLLKLCIFNHVFKLCISFLCIGVVLWFVHTLFHHLEYLNSNELKYYFESRNKDKSKNKFVLSLWCVQ